VRKHQLALALCVLGCGGQSLPLEGAKPSARTLRAEQFDSAQSRTPGAVGQVDTTGGAWRVIEVPALSSLPSIVSTPTGWLALSNRTLGDSRSPSGMESALYRSRDGVHWSLSPLESDRQDLFLRGLAYGAGHYVMIGTRGFGPGIVWSSSDGVQWTEVSQPVQGVDVWREVGFAEGLFFGFGFRYLGVSDTGRSWASVPITLVQMESVAYGNGRYLLVGSGPPQTSSDGRNWQEHRIDCSLPDACTTDPGGGVGQGFHSKVVFAEGRFFTEELSTVDGVSWQAEPGRSPSAYIGGRFLGSLSLSEGLSTWTREGAVEMLRVLRPAKAAVTQAGRSLLAVGALDREARPPESVDVSFEDGLTCETADCLVVGGQLLLVPPPGTPPLLDRVPRQADGTPLLTDECPVSRMLFCDDYTTRTGCVCNPEAPRDPEYCDDVSQFRCAGEFVPRSEEWKIEEVAEGGCTCDAADPNQPPGFGRSCRVDDQTCQVPLQCLGVDPPPSAGPPLEQPFVCTSPCAVDADCPSWEASGFCSGPVRLRCSGGSCQPRACK
jgi:hypothetical protein